MWTEYIPKYWQLNFLLKEEIVTRSLKRGDRFYSVRELMKKYKLSDSTVQKSLSKLVNEKIIRCEIGRGTFIFNPANIRLKQKPKIIKVVLPHGFKDNTTDFYYGGVVKGMLSALPLKHEFRFMNLGKKVNVSPELDLSGTSGLLIIAPGLRHKPWLLKIKNRIPAGAMIIVGACFKESGLDFVDVDNVRGADEVTEHLIRLGHKRIGIILGRIGVTNIIDRFEGYKQALKKIRLILKRNWWLKVPGARNINVLLNFLL